MYQRKDVALDFVGSAGRVDHGHDIAVIAGRCKVTFADTFKKVKLFTLEAIGRSAARRHAGTASFDGQVKHDREFREAGATREFRQALYLVGTEPAGITLVGKRTPRKAIRNDDVPCIKCWLDDFVNHLGASRIVQQEFGIVSHDTLERRVQQQLTNALRNFCATRFTQAYNLVTFGFKC